MNFRCADMVIAADGSIGLISELDTITATLQFGAGGPFRRYAIGGLRYATEDEIHAAGLGAVGRNPAPVEHGKIVRRHRHSGG